MNKLKSVMRNEINVTVGKSGRLHLHQPIKANHRQNRPNKTHAAHVRMQRGEDTASLFVLSPPKILT